MAATPRISPRPLRQRSFSDSRVRLCRLEHPDRSAARTINCGDTTKKPEYPHTARLPFNRSRIDSCAGDCNSERSTLVARTASISVGTIRASCSSLATNSASLICSIRQMRAQRREHRRRELSSARIRGACASLLRPNGSPMCRRRRATPRPESAKSKSVCAIAG